MKSKKPFPLRNGFFIDPHVNMVYIGKTLAKRIAFKIKWPRDDYNHHLHDQACDGGE